ncbi:hypothetical protein VCRA2116O29_250028 [Vibrio crassostreae]|nr:hypothetical protein VCRA2116O29_250028 [Vibrio crassostreae]
MSYTVCVLRHINYLNNNKKKYQAQKSRMFVITYGFIIKFSLSIQPKVRSEE